MSPKAWLRREKISANALAVEADVHRSIISKVVNGVQPPTYPMIALFWRRSGGLVGIDDWMRLSPVTEYAQRRSKK